MENKVNEYVIPKLTLKEVGEAKVGTRSDEVVIGLAPAFEKFQHRTLVNVEHTDILRELIAGIEEEGLHARVVRIVRTSAKYAKGESPTPVPTKNDQMARPKFMAIAALFHIKETKHVEPGAKPIEIEVKF